MSYCSTESTPWQHSDELLVTKSQLLFFSCFLASWTSTKTYHQEVARSNFHSSPPVLPLCPPLVPALPPVPLALTCHGVVDLTFFSSLSPCTCSNISFFHSFSNSLNGHEFQIFSHLILVFRMVLEIGSI